MTILITLQLIEIWHDSEEIFLDEFFEVGPSDRWS